MKSAPLILVDDLPDIGALLGPDGELLQMTTDFSARVAYPSQRALRVRQGLASVRNGCVLPLIDGQTCTDAFLDQPSSHYGAIFSATLAPRGHLKGALVMAGASNPLHFLFYYMPALLFVKSIGTPVSIFTARDFPRVMVPFMGELLPLMAGGRSVSTAELADGTYSIEDCIFPIVRTKTFFPGRTARRIVLPLALKKAGISDALRERGAIKLFLRGDQTKRRRIVNHDEVEGWFTARGYTPVDTDALTFPEQVALFVRATHIAGIEGPAFANIIFAVNAASIIMVERGNKQINQLLQYVSEDYDLTFTVVSGAPEAHAALLGREDLRVAMVQLENLDAALI